MANKKTIHVMALGLRGFPDVQGGIETHCENLFRRISNHEIAVTAIVRSRYMAHIAGCEWSGIRLVRIWSPASKNLETIVHSFLGVIYAGIFRPDVLHIHGVGPAIFTPFARILGLKVVVTHHGADYDREKWGLMAKSILRAGEALGARYANKMITVSKGMKQRVDQRHNADAQYIPNGVNIPVVSAASNELEPFGLVARKYVLLVGRFVPEKRQLDLISAFVSANLMGWKLALVGGSDHPDAYVDTVQSTAKRSENVCLTGVQRGEALRQLFSHAGIFVLPSSHEGLPIALLEALSYGNVSLASNIPPNMEVGLDDQNYFPLGDVGTIAAKLRELSVRDISDDERSGIVQFVRDRFNWDDIVDQTVCVYRSL